MKVYNENVTSLFTQSDTSTLLGEFATKKTGSYRRLLKQYYSDLKKEQSESTSDSDSTSSTTGTSSTSSSVNTTLTKMKKEADSLKSASDALDKDTLWQQTDGSYDTDKIASAIKTFATEYNDTLTQSAKASNSDITQTTTYMKNLTNTMSNALSKIGVTVGDDGKLSVDEDTLKNADMNTVKALFDGSSSYGAQVGEKASEISKETVLSTGIYSGNGVLGTTSSSIYDTLI